MAVIDRESVLAVLGRVIDPETGRDVVSQGLIQGLVVKDGNVGFSVEVDPKAGAAREPLRKACEAAVFALAGVTSVTAVLTAHRGEAPAHNHDHDHGHDHNHGHDHGHSHAPAKPAAAARPAAKPAIPGVTSIVAVASGKGGVGKSTTAVNLALGLVRLGKRVGLLDADIYGPSIPRMLGIKGKPQSKDGHTLLPMRNHGLVTMSIGFLVEEDTPMIWRGPMVISALQQMLNDVEWGELDVLVIDLPPGTGDAQLTMAQRVPLSGAVIVSTPQDIALIDARKGLNMFRKVDVPVFGIVENMSTFVCPHCGETTEIFGHGGARATAAELGCDFLGEIPLKLSIRVQSDAGVPIMIKDPDGPEARAYLAIAGEVAARLESGAGARLAPRIVIS